ncbi:MAG: translation elongation factor Ts [Candidatus Omnitrophica bacterium]|nr:translation elongation factor Ts [Candidatus Omnitrophota bacterium]MDD5351800.1 translation elongation factor Ts [Candidatus Omnitrophota bacterium]MDD5550626.1 translation elongation factor Ts [Candidatus Omnitrophota bacterium]
MAAATNKIKQLREETGAGVMDCKRALEQTGGDWDKAKELLKQKGLEMAAKKSSRVASEGRIVSYVHHNHKVGALLEINCETDFVAKNEDFGKLCRDIAMHVVATSPAYLKKEDVPKEDIPQNEDAKDFYKRTCLLEQPFVKDDKMTIGEYVASVIAKTGENIVIKRFVRLAIGEGA